MLVGGKRLRRNKNVKWHFEQNKLVVMKTGRRDEYDGKLEIPPKHHRISWLDTKTGVYRCKTFREKITYRNDN
jgi:hypothetical protein